MPALTTFVATLALLSVTANSTPVDHTAAVQKRGFSLTQVERGYFVKSGPAQIAKTFRKFGKAVPARVLAALEAVENGTAPAVPADENDAFYLAPVTMGGTEVQLNVDTGSADLQLAGHEYYKATVSASKQLADSTFRINYGDGSGAGGKVYVDKVVMGGVTATSQAIGAATSVSTAFQRDQQTDGMLGLAFSELNKISPEPQKTWFDNVKAALPAPLFAVALKYHAPGTYDFGFIDKAKYTGDITYVDADSRRGYWGFNASSYKVGTGADKPGTIKAIGDTGSTLLYLPAVIVQDFYSQIEGSTDSATEGGYIFPCDAMVPDLSITVGGIPQIVPGEHIIWAPVDEAKTMCFGGVQDGTGIASFSIFGDIFLKSKYVVHELSETPRLGFAQQAGV
ncbi:aspartic peptidase domain-containing protein [Massariosphaeria phaeospora]|uniref:Aspartic peptidase domain-containing protein n=1 Tax=Massariosphaeria phaeospora TaxID=100035 RepID=A0A7C8M953_9PLEO|nr:aspartic peptidase domain-containing protein [Massariosphaeria phaeospora]